MYWFRLGEFNSLDYGYLEIVALQNPLTVGYVVNTDTETSIRGIYNYTYDTSDGLIRSQVKTISCLMVIHRDTLNEELNLYRRKVRDIISKFRNKNLQDLVISLDDTMIYQAIPIIDPSQIEEGVYKTVVPIEFKCNPYGEERGADGVRLGDNILTSEPITITGVYPFSKTCSNGSKYPITYNGTVEVLPKIIATTLTDTSYVEFVIGVKAGFSDNAVRVDGIKKGDRVVIDCKAQSITVNGLEVTSSVTVRTGIFPYIDRGYSLAVNGANCEVTMKYNNLYE